MLLTLVMKRMIKFLPSRLDRQRERRAWPNSSSTTNLLQSRYRISHRRSRPSWPSPRRNRARATSWVDSHAVVAATVTTIMRPTTLAHFRRCRGQTVPAAARGTYLSRSTCQVDTTSMGPSTRVQRRLRLLQEPLGCRGRGLSHERLSLLIPARLLQI